MGGEKPPTSSNLFEWSPSWGFQQDGTPTLGTLEGRKSQKYSVTSPGPSFLPCFLFLFFCCLCISIQSTFLFITCYHSLASQNAKRCFSLPTKGWKAGLSSSRFMWRDIITIGWKVQKIWLNQRLVAFGCLWQFILSSFFRVTLLGGFMCPFQGLSDLHLNYKKVTWKKPDC